MQHAHARNLQQEDRKKHRHIFLHGYSRPHLLVISCKEKNDIRLLNRNNVTGSDIIFFFQYLFQNTIWFIYIISTNSVFSKKSILKLSFVEGNDADTFFIYFSIQRTNIRVNNQHRCLSTSKNKKTFNRSLPIPQEKYAFICLQTSSISTSFSCAADGSQSPLREISSVTG